MSDDEYKLKNRKQRLDDEIEKASNPKDKASKKKVPTKKEPEKSDYEKDFNVEANIVELKKKKENLLKGISGKKESEKKEIRAQLREINDEIMELESE